MSGAAPPLKLFLDEGVPRSVGEAFESAGHQVIYFHDAALPGSSDAVVCTISQDIGAVLIAIDRDMRKIARGKGVSNTRYKKLNLIQLACEEVRAAARVAEAMTLIEHEWEFVFKNGLQRMFVQIKDEVIWTRR